LRDALAKAEQLMTEPGLVEAIDGVRQDFAAHSIKKTAFERLTTMPGGPPVASSMMRCGQKLDSVRKKYIRDDVFGKELCSRISSQYDTSDPNFGALPARFDPRVYPAGSINYRDLIPGYARYEEMSKEFLGVIPYLVAAVVHHTPWLEKHLHESDDFFASRYWLQGWASLDGSKSLRKVGGILLGTQECLVTGMKASGVPLYISNNHTITQLQEKVESLEGAVKQSQEQLRMCNETMTQVR
jgi:hypothetical protein